jgi:DNA-binding IclR family transcriptional regulator
MVQIMNDKRKPTSDSSDSPSAPTRIRSVARAAQLLLWVARQPHGVTAKEIAETRGLALPTTYHLLNTLVDEGLLAKDLHRRYILGGSAAILAEAHLRGRAVPDTLLTALRDVARRTDETAYLADWGEYNIRVLGSVEGRQIVRVAEVGAGTYDHGHARANGKVLLAYASPEVREAYLRTHPLVPVTKNTICEPAQFQQELARIRERGYAYDHEEYAIGVCCVGVPLFLHGHMVAVLGLSVPTERFDERRAELTATLLDVGASVQGGADAVPAQAG